MRALGLRDAQAALLLAALVFAFTAGAESRFPPPDFVDTGHQLPTMTTPAPRAAYWDFVDIGVLAAALGTATWLIYTRRSRKGLIALSLFSLVYFGFFRRGCICSIGSVQNLALALFDSGYAAPLSAIAFFTLPIAVALFSGRAFCSGVCPHGALQDLVLIKPLKVPVWLEQGLSMLPFIYLGAGVLFAATGSAFLICQYDPFVPIFRMSGRALMVISGVVLLLLGMFVGRPYCRFLCPFGALLKMGSVVSSRRVRVTPDLCTQCRLCEASCPFGAMRTPESGRPAPRDLKRERRQLALALLITPVLIALGAWGGFKFSPTAARLHPTVSLAQQLTLNQGQPAAKGALSPADLELQRARQNPREILADAARIQHRFDIGTLLFGAWVGLVLGAKWISLTLRRTRTDYEPDRGDCVACARCFEYCPNELVRRGVIAPGSLPPGVAASSGVLAAKTVEAAR
jgi:ferredoxin